MPYVEGLPDEFAPDEKSYVFNLVGTLISCDPIDEPADGMPVASSSKIKLKIDGEWYEIKPLHLTEIRQILQFLFTCQEIYFIDKLNFSNEQLKLILGEFFNVLEDSEDLLLYTTVNASNEARLNNNDEFNVGQVIEDKLMAESNPGVVYIDHDLARSKQAYEHRAFCLRAPANTTDEKASNSFLTKLSVSTGLAKAARDYNDGDGDDYDDPFHDILGDFIDSSIYKDAVKLLKEDSLSGCHETKLLKRDDDPSHPYSAGYKPTIFNHHLRHSKKIRAKQTINLKYDRKAKSCRAKIIDYNLSPAMFRSVLSRMPIDLSKSSSIVCF